MPAVCDGLMPMPSSVMIADVAGGTLNSSAANFSTAVNGVDSGTERLQWGVKLLLVQFIESISSQLTL